MKEPNHIIIVNPRAGRGGAGQLAKELRALYLGLMPGASEDSCRIIATKEPGHATKIVRDLAAQGRCRFYAVGGDGTLNEVLNGMAGTSSSLACIPGGSGNDFIQSLTGTSNPTNLLKETILGQETLIDAGLVSGRYFLNVASIGFDARAAHKAEYFKGKPFLSPKLAYYGGILTSLGDLGPVEITVESGGRRRKTQLFMMTLCNGRVYGGGYRIAPRALLADGLFDVVEVAPLGLWKIARYLPRLKKGTHLDLPEIRFYRTDHLHLSCDEPFALNLDGETDFVREADIRLRAALIPFVLPRGAALPSAAEEESAIEKFNSLNKEN